MQTITLSPLASANPSAPRFRAIVPVGEIALYSYMVEDAADQPEWTGGRRQSCHPGAGYVGGLSGSSRSRPALL